MELVSPFQILTLIVAPAVLTNSSAVLSLSTSNRFARAVDRSLARAPSTTNSKIPKG